MAMRGRKPVPLRLQTEDKSILQKIARSQSLPWYQVRRARILLAMAAGQRVQIIAQQMPCATRTVRRTCQLYENQGLRGILKPVHRTGHPNRISPPATSASGTISVSGSTGGRTAYHPLVKPGFSTPSNGGRHCPDAQ